MRSVFVFLLAAGLVAAQQCPPFKPVCRLNCACDRNPTLTPLSDVSTANVTAAEAGLYTFRLAGQAMCGWSAVNVSVNALCTDPVPTATIVSPSQAAACASGYIVQQPINLLADGFLGAVSTSSLFNNATLQYCWCVASAPTGSQKILSSTSAKNITFTPDVPGNYWIRLTVWNGCSPSYAHLFINASCNCPPIASAGTTPTSTYTGMMPTKTNQMGLIGSYTYNSQGPLVPVSYAWTLNSWSGSAGWNMTASTGNNGADMIYNFYPIVTFTGSSVTTTVLNGPSNSTVYDNTTSEYSYGITPTTFPYPEFGRPTTSPWVQKSIRTVIVEQDTLIRRVSVNPSSFSQCTVRLYNYTSSTAWFEAEPYERCLGQFNLSLTASSQCGATSDSEVISVICGARPRAELDCGQLSKFNNTLKSFENVTVDGRSSTPGLIYSWKVIPADAAVLSARASDMRVADVQPLRAGTFYVELWVNDNANGACTPSVARVNITAGCVRGAPQMGVTVIQTPSNFQGAAFQNNLIASVSLSGYSAISDIAFAYAIQQQGTVNTAALSWIPFTPSSFPYNISQQISGAGSYIIFVMATDSCVSTTVQSTFTAVCQAGGIPVTANIVGASCTWDYQTARFHVVANASSSTVTFGRTPRFSWFSTSTFPANAFSSATSGELDVYIAPSTAYAGAGSRALSVVVGDGCSNATQTTQVTCSCPAVSNPFSTSSVSPSVTLNYIPTMNTTYYYGIYQNTTLRLQLSTVGGASPIVNPGDAITWAIATTSPSTSLTQLSATTGASPVVFTPVTSGTYTIVATFTNNCTAMFSQTFTVNVLCPTWATVTPTPMISPPLAAAGPAPAAATNIPAGGVPFDYSLGHYSEVMFKYQLPNTNLVLHPPIYYSWNVLSTPAGSKWGFTQNNYQMTTTSSSQVQQTSTQSYTLNTTVVEDILIMNRTTYLSMVATLPDHGGADHQPKNSATYANFAQTCLRPDVPGAYSVQLTMTDGCSSNTALFTFNVATCPLTVTATQITTNALTSKRVVLNVMTSLPNVPTSYNAVFVNKPCISKISDTLPTNGQSNVVSFIPDAPGTYVLQISAINNCNSASTNVTITVACDTSRYGTAQQLCPFPAIVPPLSYDTNIYTNNITLLGSNGVFPIQTLLASWYLPNSQQCSKFGTFQWNWIGYSCPLIYTPPPPAPVIPTVCKLAVNYTWLVTSAPCNSTWYPGVNGTALNNGTNYKLFSTNPTASFTPDSPGNYTFLLIVSDGCSSSNKTVHVITKCPYTHTISAQKTVITGGICNSLSDPSINMIGLDQAGISVNSTMPDASLRLNAVERTCPVIVPTTAAVNTTCPDKACFCDMKKCQSKIFCGCSGSCCCEGDPCATSGSTTGFTPPFSSSSSGAVNGGTSSGGLPPATSSGGNLTSTPTTNGGINGGGINGGNITSSPFTPTPPPTTTGTGNVTNTPTPTFGPESANIVSGTDYQDELDQAKTKYEKYLTAIWAGAMTPMSTGLAASVAYNAFSVVKYKAMLFGQGMSGGGVEMSTAPARPLV